MVISPVEIQQDTVRIRNTILNDSTGRIPDSLSIKLSPGSDSVNNALYQQDSIQIKSVFPNDSTGVKTDSLSVRLSSDPDSLTNTISQQDSVINLSRLPKQENRAVPVDITSVCDRNSVTDFTFYNPDNVFSKKTDEVTIKKFPFLFIEKAREMKADARTSLIKHLKSGQEIPSQPIHDDWIIGIILIAAFLYSLIRISSKRSLPAVSRFLILIGINDPSAKDIEGIFNWQSTIHNLFSFLVIALFANCTADYYNFNLFGIRGILLFIIFLFLIITGVTLRHIVCVITGKISGEEDAFREYLTTVYQSYRLSAMILLMLVILILYTMILPVKILIITGATTVGILYLIRIFRLMIIFLSHNISIFYLFLYLCALEILPVLISLKYFAGLI